jgi:hypothetical protein
MQIVYGNICSKPERISEIHRFSSSTCVNVNIVTIVYVAGFEWPPAIAAVCGPTSTLYLALDLPLCNVDRSHIFDPVID